MSGLREPLEGQDPRTLENRRTENLGSADKAGDCKNSRESLQKVEISITDNRPMKNNQAQTPKRRHFPGRL